MRVYFTLKFDFGIKTKATCVTRANPHTKGPVCFIYLRELHSLHNQQKSKTPRSTGRVSAPLRTAGGAFPHITCSNLQYRQQSAMLIITELSAPRVRK
jgi:hypothetical protein